MLNQKLMDAASKYFIDLIKDNKWAIVTISSYRPNEIQIEWGDKLRNERAIATRTFFIEDDSIGFYTKGHAS